MEILKLSTVDSTNTWVAQHEGDLSNQAIVYCEEQTAGRGQRGNSWESEAGENITASMIFHPGEFEASRQFSISESVSLAIVEFLREYGVEAKIKWPNDIYVGDKKISGILVEHHVLGRYVARSIAGMGINMNQEVFRSDAPNPVSLWQLTAKKNDIDEAVKKLARHLEKCLANIDEPGKTHAKFINLLWRKDGHYHNFYDRKESEQIEARIEGVEMNGLLTLQLKGGERRQYAFKEVEFIL